MSSTLHRNWLLLTATIASLTTAGAIPAEASAQWPEFGQSASDDIPVEELLPGQTPAARRSPERPAPEATPSATDGRCGKFGFRSLDGIMIPVAYPLVNDLTRYGRLQMDAVRLADATAEQLTMTGAFSVNGRDQAPVGGAISWISPLAFDFLGWRGAGAWMVVTASINPAGTDEGNVRKNSRWVDGAGDGGTRDAGTADADPDEMLLVSFSAWLTEEGDHLEISNATATVRRKELGAFAGLFVGTVAQCITGTRGAAGSRIAYARKTGDRGTKEIWVTRVGSGEQTKVSADGVLAMLPAWAPGGSLAWTGYRDGNPDLYVDGIRFGSRDGMNTGVAWSPDGTKAAVTWAPEAATDIYLVHPQTGSITKRLTSSPAIDASPAWSPDSAQIAFVSDRNGSPGIFVMNADGSGTRQLPLEGEYNTGPDWSPDGQTILYQSRGARSRFSIWAFDLTTKTSRKLTRDSYNNEEPSWSPDGRFISYTSTRNGRKHLFIMNRDGSGPRPVFQDDSEYFTPAWERSIPLRKAR